MVLNLPLIDAYKRKYVDFFPNLCNFLASLDVLDLHQVVPYIIFISCPE